jgi:hypothetical protein
MRFLARILTNNYLEGTASYPLAPLWRDKLCKVERAFNTKGYHDKLPIWLIEPLNVYQTEFRSRIVDLKSAILNTPSENDSNGQVSSSDVMFGVGPEEDITEEDIDDQDSDSDEESSPGDDIDED